MRVALCNRKDWREKPGGDVVQMLETKQALERAGVDVLVAQNADDLQMADVVHVFNCQTIEDSLQWIELAKAAGKPTALSTIFWDLSHYYYVSNLFKLGIDYTRHNLEFAKPCFDAFARLSAGLAGKPAYYGASYVEQVRRAAGLVDMLLPNSQEEAQIFAQFFQLGSEKMEVVLNATGQEVFRAGGRRRDIDILSVGRLEPTKNQLSVVRAFAGTTCQIRLVGGEGENRKYLQALYQAAEDAGNVSIVSSNVPRDEVAELMSRARVHALPSFRESPGLVTLEALASGCLAVVAGPRFCPVDSYFGDLYGRTVFSCDPYSCASVASAIALALINPYGERPELSEQLSWDAVGAATLAVYRKLVS